MSAAEDNRYPWKKQRGTTDAGVPMIRVQGSSLPPGQTFHRRRAEKHDNIPIKNPVLPADTAMAVMDMAVLRKLLPPPGKRTDQITPVEALASLYYRRRVRDSLMEWSILALSDQGYLPAEHHRLIIRHLEQMEHGEFDRLMIFMPPGSAKSEYCSKIFPAWFLQRHPTAAVIACSHTQQLAESFGRRVRNLMDEHSAALGVKLAEDSQAAGQWRTEQDGVYLAAGVQGKITGRRADLAVIDDPVASYEDASSVTNREKLWNWYRNDLYTRLKPGAKIVVVMTRWHQDDISGRLEEEMKQGTGDTWKILRLPAICNALDDPLGRKIGDPLWPDWEDLDALARKRATVGERAWTALYQQDPRPEDGSIFNISKIPAALGIGEIPEGTKWCRGWDLAATEQIGGRDPDWTVGVLMGRTPAGGTIVGDVVRVRGTSEVVEAVIHSTTVKDGQTYGKTKVLVGIPQDPGAAGKAYLAYLVRMLIGYNIVTSLESGDKATRATPFASQLNNGQVKLVHAEWNRVYTEELAGFPAGTKDDQVDASSRAFNTLATPPRRKTKMQSIPNLYNR